MISDEEMQWIESVLPSRYGRVVCVEKQTSTGLGCVSIVTTTDGTLYFKSGSGTEAQITAQLFEQFPTLMPMVVGAESQNNWLLSENGGARLSESNSVKLWFSSIQCLASFHHASMQEINSSLRNNKYISATTFSAFEANWQDANWINYFGIESGVQKLVSESMLELQNSILAVEQLGLKSCICHGDAQPMNCLSGKRGILWFDWREAQVFNPAIDIGWFLVWLMPPREHLYITVTEKLLTEFLNSYLNVIEVKTTSVDIFRIMQYSLAHRILYFSKQTSDYASCKIYVPYLSRLLRRVLSRKIG